METAHEGDTPQFPPEGAEFPPQSDAAAFGARLAAARQAAGFKSARALSRAVGVSDGNVRAYEKGDQEPTRPVLVNLAAVCHVSIDWLARGEGPMACPAVGSTTPDGLEVNRGPVMPIAPPARVTPAEPTLFSMLDFDGAAAALEEAAGRFAARGSRPTNRELVFLMALIYDERLEKKRVHERDDAKTPSQVTHE